jgi:ComF family protein
VVDICLKLLNIKKVCANNSVQVKSFIKETLTDFISLFYPNYCYACNEGLAKGEDIVCTKCRLDLPKTNYHKTLQNPLYNRLHGRFPLEFAVAFLLFRKGGKVQNLLHALKYLNHPEIGLSLGMVYSHELREHNFQQQIDGIIPVPLHPSRRRKRGYNQSEEFAKGLSQMLDKPVLADALERTHRTDSQTRKTKLKRWQNVQEVFRVKNPSMVEGRKLLLVDDVITTGATIEACSTALLSAQCLSIGVAGIAYAEEVK